jgi:RNA polymerase sigma factor (sigma-70 family)
MDTQIQSTDHFQFNIENTIEQITRELDISIDQSKIVDIIITNQENGRIKFYCEGENQDIQSYIKRVVTNYNRQNNYLRNIQIERDNDEWEKLFEKLNNWANRFFISKGFSVEQVINESAFGLASEAALAILNANFPYDVEFDSWAFIILENCCLKYMRSNMKKSVIPPQKIVYFEDYENCDISDNENIPGEIIESKFDDLLFAINHLTPLRKQVIKFRYFENFQPEKIAEIMGKTPSAVYSLQFNALQDLRKILIENGILY